MGIDVVRRAIDVDSCRRWLHLADEVHRHPDRLPAGSFVRESSSFRLADVDESAIATIWWASDGEARRRCHGLVGQRLAIDVDQCWVRRQYAPAQAPVGHHPHSWHQDGALLHDFAASPAGELLPMVTFWIALTRCGDVAPGVELVTDPLDAMLALPELAPAAVAARWPQGGDRPQLDAGDALVFTSDVLHRTHVAATMHSTRTSIELRCVPADHVPERLGGDRFLVVEPSAAGDGRGRQPGAR